MPLVSKSAVTSRQQSIMGQARIIDEAARIARVPAPAEIPRPQDKWAIPAGGDVRRTAPAPAVAVAPTIPKRRPGRPTNAEIAERRRAAANGSGIELEIEYDIPVPPLHADVSPFFESVKRLTRKGAFFFVPETKRSRSVAAMIRDIAYRLKVKLTIRRNFVHPKTKQIGIGVWRIE